MAANTQTSSTTRKTAAPPGMTAFRARELALESSSTIFEGTNTQPQRVLEAAQQFEQYLQHGLPQLNGGSTGGSKSPGATATKRTYARKNAT